MKYKTKSNIVLVVIVIAVLAGVAIVPVGYIKNIVKLCHCDFQSPYKAEVIRTVGILVPPVGVVAGYCKIDDGPNKK